MPKQTSFGPKSNINVRGESSGDPSARLNPPLHSGTSGTLMKPSGGFPQEKSMSKKPRHNPKK